MTRVAFRVDVSSAIGSGHVSRCVSLAQELQKRGADILFILREHPTPWPERLTSEGFHVEILPANPAGQPKTKASPHASSLSGSASEDAEKTRELLQKKPTDILIVDHYALDQSWESQLRPVVKKIVVIDDLADRPHDCDVLIDMSDPSGDKMRYQNLVPTHATVLCGPRYYFIRDEFLSSAQKKRDFKIVKNVVVFFGSGDPTHSTLFCAKVLKAAKEFAGIRFRFVVGDLNPDREEISSLLQGDARFHVDLKLVAMAKILEEADVAVGAGGVNMWERFYMQLPSVVMSLADNQSPQCDVAADAGAILYLGNAAHVQPQEFVTALRFVCENATAREVLAQKGASFVDGRGLLRVSDSLLPPQIQFRPITIADTQKTFEWRNHPTTRRHSGDGRELDPKGHAEWLEKVVSDPNRLLWMASDDSGEIGVVRFDLAGERALVSIYLAPHITGRGTFVLQAAAGLLQKQHPEIVAIDAEIQADNTASQVAFAKAGYVPVGGRYEKRLKD